MSRADLSRKSGAPVSEEYPWVSNIKILMREIERLKSRVDELSGGLIRYEQQIADMNLTIRSYRVELERMRQEYGRHG